MCTCKSKQKETHAYIKNIYIDIFTYAGIYEKIYTFMFMSRSIFIVHLHLHLCSHLHLHLLRDFHVYIYIYHQFIKIDKHIHTGCFVFLAGFSHISFFNWFCLSNYGLNFANVAVACFVYNQPLRNL